MDGPRRVQPPGTPSLAWRIIFVALVAALLVFAAWSLLLVSRVQALRADVARNVRWLGDIGELQHRTAQRREGGGSSGRAEWTAAADTVAALADQGAGDDALATPLAEAAAALAPARRDPAALPALELRLDALVREIRRDNAARSAELGECWGDLVFVVFTALLLAALDVVLLAYAERRRRQALRLAAEIEATAEQLADTRAALREREAVARLADELRAARDRAEEASAAKTQFMARMSHELFTPLNIITGYAALVRERCEEQAVAEAAGDLERIEQAADGLYRLVRHVLDLTELDAGRAEVVPTEFGLADLVEQVVAAAASTAARSGTRVAADVPRGLTIRSDRARLATILGELLDNACRFTRGGRVEIGAETGDGVRIVVRDDGPGMSDEACREATAPFFQVDESARRRHDGAGLGLTVAARLCARLGGTLTLRSAPGQGTTATVHLPGAAVG